MKIALKYLLIVLPTLVFSQNFDWFKTVGDIKDDFGQWVRTDSAGNIYVAGAAQGTCNFDSYSITSVNRFNFVGKYDSAGNNLWVTELPLAQPNYAFFFQDFQVSPRGEAYLVGYLNTNGAEFGRFLKFDNAGNKIMETNPFQGTRVPSIAFTSHGDYYTLAKLYTGITVAKYSSNDVLQWEITIDATLKYDDNPTLEVIGDDNFLVSFLFDNQVTVTGNSQDTVTLHATQGILSCDRAIARFNSNGELLWAKNYNNQMLTRKIAVSKATGTFYMLCSSTDYKDYLLGFDSLGTKQFENLIQSYDVFDALAMLPHLYVHNETIYYVASGFDQPITNGSIGSFALKVFDVNGLPIGEMPKPSGMFPILGDIAFYNEKLVMVGGTTSGTWGNQTIVVNGTGFTDYFLAKLDSISTGITNVSEPVNSFESVSIYPNPASSSITISNTTSEDVTIMLQDLLGNVVMQPFKIGGGVVQVSVASLPTGMYILTMQNTTAIHVSKLIKN